MKLSCQPLNRGRVIRVSAALCLLVGLLWASGLRAQSPEEHASHHPAAAGAGAMPAAPGAAPAMGAMPTAGGGPGPGGKGPPAGVGPPTSAGGMMEGMGEMMKGMHGSPPPKELYPSLMALPELSPEQRKQVEGQAGERMHAGSVLMGQALDSLNTGAQSGDYAAMHEAMTRLREGAAQLESGIAARRALAEGRAPRAVALAWFKQEMNLSPGAAPAAHQRFGGTPFHLFTMVLLIAFALAMVAMYFFKMRRCAALFGRIEADKGSPPPGSSPPLAGGKPPAAPADKPAAPADKPAAAADKPAAPADKPGAPAAPAAPADKPAAADNILAAAADKLAAAADKLAAATEKVATATDEPAAPADEPAPADNKLAAAAEKLATAAEKLATAADKPAAPAHKPAAAAHKPARFSSSERSTARMRRGR